MVGLALAIFFLLLISLSEHIAFWKAYLVSAVACIGLQAVYLANVLGHWKRGLGFATLLTVLYGALYGLLVSENNALLIDRKSTRLNSSHSQISYAVFCLKKKKKE